MPTSREPARITVLISGNGTNLQALINSCRTPSLPNAEIIHVISNRRAAYGLTRARDAGINTDIHTLAEFKKKFTDPGPNGRYERAREEYDIALVELVLGKIPNIVVLAGFMHILGAQALEKLDREGIPLINLHPALPGQFNGANAIERAYAASKEGRIANTGVMVHRVVAEVDMGEPLLIREIPIHANDTLAELEKRIHDVEHEVIVQGTRMALDSLR